MEQQSPSQPGDRQLWIVHALVDIAAHVIPSRWLYRFAEKYGSPENVTTLWADCDPGMRTTWWPPAYLEVKQ
jgi:hypothetical protein